MKRMNILGMTAVAASLAIAGCGSDDDGGTGTMSLDVTDAPVDNATAVTVEFTGVEVKPAEGRSEVFDFDSARSIDLLALQGSDSDSLLADEPLPAGEYNFIKLKVNAAQGQMDSTISLDDGNTHSLFVPSGGQDGLKLVQGFTVPVNGSVDFTVDFDLRKSVSDPESGQVDYILRPALRLVDNTEVGHIAGTVDSATASDSACSPAVYAYEGSDVTPDDVGSSTEPVTTSQVSDDGSGTFEYELGFLVAGDYTVALTCDADADEADTDDNISFEGSQNATVEADQTTTVDF